MWRMLEEEGGRRLGTLGWPDQPRTDTVPFLAPCSPSQGHTHEADTPLPLHTQPPHTLPVEFSRAVRSARKNHMIQAPPSTAARSVGSAETRAARSRRTQRARPDPRMAAQDSAPPGATRAAAESGGRGLQGACVPLRCAAGTSAEASWLAVTGSSSLASSSRSGFRCGLGVSNSLRQQGIRMEGGVGRRFTKRSWQAQGLRRDFQRGRRATAHGKRSQGQPKARQGAAHKPCTSDPGTPPRCFSGKNLRVYPQDQEGTEGAEACPLEGNEQEEASDPSTPVVQRQGRVPRLEGQPPAATPPASLGIWTGHTLLPLQHLLCWEPWPVSSGTGAPDPRNARVATRPVLLQTPTRNLQCDVLHANWIQDLAFMATRATIDPAGGVCLALAPN